MKIVVLAGGISTEREISIVSGTDVCKALRARGHRAVLADVFCGIESLEGEHFPEAYDCDRAAAYIRSFDARIEELKRERREFFGPNVLELCREAEMVFLALHGENGENGKVQAAFDLLGIRYTGSGHLGSALAMDKGMTKKIFAMNQVPSPAGCTLEAASAGEEIPAGMRLPLVVKTCCGGSSVGVYIARTPEEYRQALQDVFSYEETAVVEEYIQGREFSVGVVDGKAYPVIEIAPLQGFYDYKNKYQPGSTVETCPADLSAELTERMQRYAEAGYRALGLEGYGRLDFMMRENGEMFCLEANTLPGMTPTSLLPQEAAALGMDYPQLCDELIRVSLKKYTAETSGEEV